MENYLPSVIIGLVVIVLVIRNQVRARPLTPWRAYGVPLAFAAYGIGMVVTQDHGRVLDPAHETLSVLLLAAELAAGVLLGWVRAATVTVWRDAQGVVWRRGGGWTVAAWIGSILARLGLAGVGYLLGVHSAAGAFMVFFAVTLVAQNVILDRRGRVAGHDERRTTADLGGE